VEDDVNSNGADERKSDIPGSEFVGGGPDAGLRALGAVNKADYLSKVVSLPTLTALTTMEPATVSVEL